MWILMHADDIALISGDVASVKAAIGLLDTVFSDWGLTVSTAKTNFESYRPLAEMRNSSGKLEHLSAW